ncbi:MAG: hypothetical protein CVV10_07935 [Gammaproteobacteria bacterium HGW-Gammaproteobacteria-14]|nr:MAG: hypothetical protein CVV10_07935 [Gammaproteobacteria bacterium HGW-Gammaproteobacteria-14]
MYRILVVGFFFILFPMGLVGCGGSSSGGGGQPDDVDPFNVASQENGGVATATFDSENAGLVNDGSFNLIDGVNAGLFWSGNIVGDSLTIELDGDYLVAQVILYTNGPNNTETTLQYSADGVNFTNIKLLGGDCPSLALGSGRIHCTFSEAREMSHLRVVINANPETVRLYELLAIGIPAAN